SWAAPAATVRPPEPAPITHKSARSSPPAVLVIAPLLDATVTSARSLLGPVRTKPTARSLGCCMAVPPSPERHRSERRDAYNQQRQQECPGNERACMNGELASCCTALGHALSVLRL